jgi:hypothetical protein
MFYRKGLFMTTKQTNYEAMPLAAPYQRKIGRVTFRISSYGNPNAQNSAQDLILRIMEGRLKQNITLTEEE